MFSIKLNHHKQFDKETTMKEIKLLHKKLQTACPSMHAYRCESLMVAVISAMTSQQLTVTGLGRNIKSQSNTVTKFDIKRMDRLIGNPYLHDERVRLYHYMAHQFIGKTQHPVLLIDWSPIPGQEIFQLLRLSIPMEGRSLTIYEQSFEESQLNNSEVHQKFIEQVKLILPEGCEPIIISDAIFKTQWFQAIEAMGWYWIGRVRGNIQLSKGGGIFHTCTKFMKEATRKAKSLGQLFYSKQHQHPCIGTLYKEKPKGRTKKKKRGGKSKDGKDIYHSNKSQQPWLLVSHLPKPYQQAERVVKLYRLRMQIEEGFRDSKNQQYGLGLNQAKSRSPQRYDNLLLIGALALFVMWCIGQVGIQKCYHHQLQANTVRNKTVLSNIYLAIQMIGDSRYPITAKEFMNVFLSISSYVQTVENVP